MSRSAVVAKKFWSSDRLALQATSGSDPLLLSVVSEDLWPVTERSRRSCRLNTDKSWARANDRNPSFS